MEDFNYHFNSDVEEAAQAAVAHQELQNTRRAQVQQAQQAQQQQQQQQQQRYSYRLSKSIFTDKQNRSLLFYFKPDDPMKNKYKVLIIQYGGIVVDDPRTSTETIYLNDNDHLNTRLVWVDDCINSMRLLPMDGYINDTMSNFDDMLSIGQIENEAPRRVKKPRNIHKFTREKDNYILEQVRANPQLRHSHKFYAFLSTHDILKGHTGNSIRSRYRRHLVKDLGFVYKLTPNGKIMKGEDGMPLKTSIDEVGTIKNKFTPEDDYQLCMEAEQYSKEMCEARNLPYDIDAPTKLPYSFFSNMYRKNSLHSLNSWRDRYRKYVARGLIGKYIRYYDQCIKEQIQPRVVTKFMDLSKLKYSNEVEKLKSLGNIKIEPGFSPEQSSLSSADFVENAQALTTALDEEMGGSNIDEALMVKHAGDHIQVPKLTSTDGVKIKEEKEEEREDVEESGEEEEEEEDDNNFLSQSQLQSQLQDTDFKYLDKSVQLSDIVNDRIYNYYDNEKRVEEIAKITRNSQSITELFLNLNKLGFKDKFICHVFYATSGDTLLIGQLCELFITNLTEYLQKDMDIPIYKLLKSNIPGVWNEKLDALLQSNQTSELLEFQSKKSIRERERFLSELHQGSLAM